MLEVEPALAKELVSRRDARLLNFLRDVGIVEAVKPTPGERRIVGRFVEPREDV